jgi:hypothetical protein
MSKRLEIRQQRLEALESEFRVLLPRVLKECAAGRWGLFGQNDQREANQYLRWPEAERLKDMASEIKLIRDDSGEQNEVLEKFLHYCSLGGANVPGEPRLAQSLLAELNSERSRSQ